MNTKELLTYWKKVKETIHLFDNIIVRYVVQWSNILLIMIGASALAYPTSNLIAGTFSLAAAIVSVPIAIKCKFYYELLEEALSLGIDVEKLIFKGDESQKLGLTYRLTSISTRTIAGSTFFAWSIYLPFVVIFILSLTLAAFYFTLITTPLQIAACLVGGTSVALFLFFLVGVTSKRQ